MERNLALMIVIVLMALPLVALAVGIASAHRARRQDVATEMARARRGYEARRQQLETLSAVHQIGEISVPDEQLAANLAANLEADEHSRAEWARQQNELRNHIESQRSLRTA